MIVVEKSGAWTDGRRESTNNNYPGKPSRNIVNAQDILPTGDSVYFPVATGRRGNQSGGVVSVHLIRPVGGSSLVRHDGRGGESFGGTAGEGRACRCGRRRTFHFNLVALMQFLRRPSVNNQICDLYFWTVFASVQSLARRPIQMQM